MSTEIRNIKSLIAKMSNIPEKKNLKENLGTKIQTKSHGL